MDLTVSDIDKLRMNLDSENKNGVKNWEDLARKLKLERLISGWRTKGNPTFNFLKKLKQRKPSLTVSDFSEVARQHCREDVMDFLKKCSGIELLKDLIETSDVMELCDILNGDQPGIRDWTFFAEELGFSSELIDSIANEEKFSNKLEPTKELITYLQHTECEMKLSQFKEECKKIQRTDVALILEDIIKKKVEEEKKNRK